MWLGLLAWRPVAGTMLKQADLMLPEKAKYEVKRFVVFYCWGTSQSFKSFRALKPELDIVYIMVLESEYRMEYAYIQWGGLWEHLPFSLSEYLFSLFVVAIGRFSLWWQWYYVFITMVVVYISFGPGAFVWKTRRQEWKENKTGGKTVGGEVHAKNSNYFKARSCGEEYTIVIYIYI